KPRARRFKRSSRRCRRRTILRRSGPTPPGGTDQTCAYPRSREAMPDADLLTFEPLDAVVELLSAAMKARYVLLASATKVLHRKRTGLIPVLDSVVVGPLPQSSRGGDAARE